MSSSKQAIVSLVLIIPLIVSGLALVTSQNKYRKLFFSLEKEQTLSKQMDIEYSQLELDHSLLAKQLRVASKAKDSLDMVSLTPTRVDYVSLAGTALEK